MNQNQVGEIKNIQLHQYSYMNVLIYLTGTVQSHVFSYHLDLILNTLIHNFKQKNLFVVNITYLSKLLCLVDL